MQMTGGQALAQQLAREGVDQAFVVPGVQLDWAVDGLRALDGRIAVTIPRHEQATSYMADGYARSSGRVGVCMTVPGPGVTNALAGLATAYACSSPVLAICGQVHSKTLGRGYGMLHELRDQSAMLAGVTKWHGIAMTPQEIPALVRRAFVELRSGRPQPVAIELPHDVLAATASLETIDPPRGFDGRRSPDPQAVRAAAELLTAARFPVIYAGGGAVAADAQLELAALAERLQAPVVMGEMGRGALSDRHPLALDTLAARPVMRRADVVLVVGSRFMSRMAPVPSWTGEGVRYVYVNADAADVTPPRRVDVFVHADARLALAALHAEVPGTGTRRTEMVAAARRWAQAQLATLQPQYGYVQALRRAIPDDGVLVGELTQVGYLATVAYPVWSPRTLLSPGYQGTLGYGFPTALGVQVAHPRRTVVSITGDGGFGWSMQELATARRYDLPLITVVFNDARFGNVRLLQQQTFGYEFGTELCNPRFDRLADAFDVGYARAESPEQLQQAIERARADGGPTLIEAPVGEMPSPWPYLRLASPFKAPEQAPPDPLAAFD